MIRSISVISDLPRILILFISVLRDSSFVIHSSGSFPVTCSFEFTNTGDEPLIISNAKGSCGCTVPEWPKEPIAPGETGEIAVEYKPAGQSGVQTKYVTITANTSPATTQLTITGDIQADPNAPQQPAQPIAPEGINIQ